MSPDDLTDRDLLELLEQARHDLQMCKKSLAFKESLLTDLEIENAELSEVNEKLDRELKILKRRESRRFESTGSTEDCVDDGYGHWSNDEDEVPTFLPTKISESKVKLDACSNCRDHAVEREELFERIEELHQQVEVVQKVNKLLQEDVSQKAAQISDLRQALLDKQVREERLEADLEFTAAEREIALRDLHDFHSTTLSSRRSSEEYLRSSSIGSSIGDELGMPKRRICEDITLPIQSFMEWEKFLAEPEAGPFSELESVSMESSRESFLGEHSHSSDSEQATFSETAGSALDDSSGTGTVASETDRRSENPNPPTHKSIEDWNGTRYLSHQYFGWRSLVCCGPTPETPKRERTVAASNSRKERAGFLSLFKRRIVKNN